MWKSLIGILAAGGAIGVVAISQVNVPSLPPVRVVTPEDAQTTPTTIVHLFEWTWPDIGAECKNFLGPKGFKSGSNFPAPGACCLSRLGISLVAAVSTGQLSA